MLCPNCKSSMLKCIDSRPIGGRTRRRHECLKCRGRFSTVEISVDEFKALQLREKLLADVLEFSRKAEEKLNQ